MIITRKFKVPLQDDTTLTDLKYKCNYLISNTEAINTFEIELETQEEYDTLLNLIEAYSELQDVKFVDGILKVFVPEVGMLEIREYVSAQKINKTDLENLGFKITSLEEKSYGTYISGILKYNKYNKVEITVSNIKDEIKSYINLRESYYRGHINGYLNTKEQLQNILSFITSERN